MYSNITRLIESIITSKSRIKNSCGLLTNVIINAGPNIIKLSFTIYIISEINLAKFTSLSPTGL